jgi:hypothetical protein
MLAAGCGPLTPFGVAPGAGRWTSVAGLGVPRDDFGLAAAGGRLYAVGGMTGARGNALDSVEVYDPAANAWARGPRLPTPLSSIRAVALGGRIYAAGGARDDGEIDLVWSLATGGPPPAGDAPAWRPAAPLGLARLGHGLAPLSGRLYAAGGLHGGEPTDSVEAYDPEANRWSPAAPLPRARYNLGLLAVGGRLYACGGSDSARRPTADVFVFEPSSGRWTAGPALPEPLSSFGAAVLGDRRAHLLHHRTHVVLDARAGTWLRARPMPTSRHGLGAVESAGRLLAVGGCSEEPQRDLAAVEAFEPYV